jgi:ABC-type Fe3+-siderophore transport system permease subunit
MNFQKNKFIKILAIVSIILAIASIFFTFIAVGLIIPALILLLTKNRKIYLIFSTILILEYIGGILIMVFALSNSTSFY